MSSTIRNFFPDLQVFPALGNHDYWPQVKHIRNLFMYHIQCVPNTQKAGVKKKSQICVTIILETVFYNSPVSI